MSNQVYDEYKNQDQEVRRPLLDTPNSHNTRNVEDEFIDHNQDHNFSDNLRDTKGSRRTIIEEG